MTPIHWSDSARADLRAVQAYIARDSAVYAQRFVDRIRAAVEALRTFPESGAMVPEWDRQDIREIFVGQYRVLYRIRPRSLEVVRVIHGARQLPDTG